jgi:hypothetical protein
VSADGALLGFADNPVMRRIEVKQLDYGLTPVGGLALAAKDLKALGSHWLGSVAVACYESSKRSSVGSVMQAGSCAAGKSLLRPRAASSGLQWVSAWLAGVGKGRHHSSSPMRPLATF